MQELRTLQEGAPYKSDNDGYILTCPLCGGDYLHHSNVEIFEREEDEEKGLHVVIKEGCLNVNNTLTGNPSHRRNGLKIRFWCEHCQGNLPAMVISQHKGRTSIGWEGLSEVGLSEVPAEALKGK